MRGGGLFLSEVTSECSEGLSISDASQVGGLMFMQIRKRAMLLNSVPQAVLHYLYFGLDFPNGILF